MPEEKQYRVFDEELDLYRYVDDVKYNFDYSKSDIMKTRETFHKGFIKDAKRQVESMYGIHEK